LTKRFLKRDFGIKNLEKRFWKNDLKKEASKSEGFDKDRT